MAGVVGCDTCNAACKNGLKISMLVGEREKEMNCFCVSLCMCMCVCVCVCVCVGE